MPATRYVGSDKALFAAIKPGDYVGATVTQRRGGNLQAQEVYLYAEACAAPARAVFPKAAGCIVNGTVSAAATRRKTSRMAP